MNMSERNIQKLIKAIRKTRVVDIHRTNEAKYLELVRSFSKALELLIFDFIAENFEDACYKDAAPPAPPP